jgi:hypothetical protein
MIYSLVLYDNVILLYTLAVYAQVVVVHIYDRLISSGKGSMACRPL